MDLFCTEEVSVKGEHQDLVWMPGKFEKLPICIEVRWFAQQKQIIRTSGAWWPDKDTSG